LTQSDGAGGAARAALRLLACFLSTDIDAKMLVVSKSTNKDEVLKISGLLRIKSSIYSRIDKYFCAYVMPNCREWKTSGLFGVVSAKSLNASEFDTINLHWIGHGLISLNQVNKVRKRIIWTLHDEWIIEGPAHYGVKTHDVKKTFYLPLRKTILRFFMRFSESQRKTLVSNPNVVFIPVSSEIKKKFLAKYPNAESRVHVIPNALDTSFFHPTEQLVRKLPIVLFLGGDRDPRKGWDLLRQACLQGTKPYNLIIPGSKLNGMIGKINITGIPKIDNPRILHKYLSNADVVVVPSRAEALPQVATEAISCGTPVVSFNVGGLPDIVIENHTGVLVNQFNTKEFSEAIDKVLMQGKIFYSHRCRKFALKNFSFPSISKRYQVLI